MTPRPRLPLVFAPAAAAAFAAIAAVTSAAATNAAARAGVPAASAGKPASADAGRGYYTLHCAGCHQADGSGSAAHEIPNMKGAVGHFLRLPEGRAFLVQVPGTANSPLTDAEVAVLLNWMLPQFSRAELPPGFVPYTAEEVTRLRKQRLDDVAATRAALVARLAGMGYPVEPTKEQRK
jgi:mono/diheme cytochrome c family protein